MYNYFVIHHRLNNLIWVWNANALANPEIGDYYQYFPGLDVVDVLATDFYGGRYDMSNYTKLLELGAGKLIAIGECGDLPTPGILNQQPDWSWFMCWANYLKKNKNEVILNLYNDSRVITRK